MINTGRDLLLQNGDIVFAGDNLATVGDEDNVKQQAYLRLLTDLGESVFFSDFGALFIIYASKPYTEENARKVEAEARVALLKVGTQSGGESWIEKVLECRLQLTEIDGKKVKMLYAKYLIRDNSEPQELSLALGGESI